MARLVMVAPDDDAPPPPPRCRHVGCGAPGTEVTVLVRGRRSWELFHCLDHAADGLAIATGAGFVAEQCDDSEAQARLVAASESDSPVWQKSA